LFARFVQVRCSVPIRNAVISMERVVFTTRDGVRIVGDYTAGDSSRTIILLHMMPATRASWRPLVAQLTDAGFGTLAIDLRGHGESTRGAAGVTLDFKKFSDAEHQASIHDVEGAVEWLLREHGIGEEEIAFVGASIGANLSLQYLAEHKNVPTAVLLSPGLDYHGISAETLIAEIQPTQSLFFIAASDDEYSSRTVVQLAKMTDAQQKTENYPKGGHGTTLFDTHPKLISEIVEWLQSKL